jgi:hypothetical protein
MTARGDVMAEAMARYYDWSRVGKPAAGFDTRRVGGLTEEPPGNTMKAEKTN